MNKPLVLAVEDNADTLSSLRLSLSQEGFHVVTVSDGEAALRALESLKPDLILTDLMMPKLNGVDMIKELRSRQTLSGIPVIVVSAFLDEYGEAAVQAGATVVLRKPQEMASLIETINRAVGR